MNHRETFIEFLHETGFFSLQVMEKFDHYHRLLVEENQKINLFSRKMDNEEIWSIHFLDSLLILRTPIRYEHQTLMDFGTGGGLPGIPLKIVFPEVRMVFLDSILKKIKAVKNFCNLLDLKGCDFVCSRIEDIPRQMTSSFDGIICRSVRVLPEFVKPMSKLLKNEGKIILYKAKQIEDAELFGNYQIHDVSHPLLGERKIVEIDYGKNNYSG